MTSQKRADLDHASRRAKDLIAAGQPIEALRLGLGDMMADQFNRVPEHCREGLAIYLLFGIPPGDFLIAVLCNDLMGAVTRADDINRDRLRDYAIALYNGAPAGSYGSVTAFRAWCGTGGAFGRALAKEEA